MWSWQAAKRCSMYKHVCTFLRVVGKAYEGEIQSKVHSSPQGYYYFVVWWSSLSFIFVYNPPILIYHNWWFLKLKLTAQCPCNFVHIWLVNTYTNCLYIIHDDCQWHKYAFVPCLAVPKSFKSSNKVYI